MHRNILLVLLLFSIWSCADSEKSASNTLLIAAASNVQFVLEELVSAFEDSTGIKCDVVMSSSGKLASQISSGATYDVFVSADQYYPSYLEDEGLTIGKSVTYAVGKLILWSTRHELGENIDLRDVKYEQIAIANPKIAPYGKAAVSALQATGVYETVEDRLVFGENISQVNQFVSVGAADIGVTSQSVVLSAGLRSTGSWVEISDSLYQPILQDAIALKNGKSLHADKKKFLDFLLGARGQSILEKYGYEE